MTFEEAAPMTLTTLMSFLNSSSVADCLKSDRKMREMVEDVNSRRMLSWMRLTPSSL